MLEYTVTQKIANCNHHNRKQFRLPKGCEYFSYIACLDCGAFIQWAQDDPKIVKERSERILMIEQLLNTKVLNQGDKEFLNLISTRRLLFSHEAKKYHRMLVDHKML